MKKKKYKAEIKRLNAHIKDCLDENNLLLDVVSYNLKTVKFKNEIIATTVLRRAMNRELKKEWVKIVRGMWGEPINKTDTFKINMITPPSQKKKWWQYSGYF